MDHIWIVTERFTAEVTEADGQVVQYEEIVAVYLTEQTANQHVDRGGRAFTARREEVRTNLRSY